MPPSLLQHADHLESREAASTRRSEFGVQRDRHSHVSDQSFVSRLLGAFRDDSHADLHAIECVQNGNHLVMRGTVPSYYLKQLCTAIALRHSPKQYTICNHVRVVTPATDGIRR
jgi:hypothetical protein